MRTIIQTCIAIGMVGILCWYVSARMGGFLKTGEEGSNVWFYDMRAKRLYVAPRDTVPPDKQNGVKAVVVAFRGAMDDSSNRRIAYLETCAPELKNVLEEIRAAHASGRAFKGRMPSRSSDFFQTNSLVKLVDELDWHPLNSPEAREVINQWRTWRGPDGQPPIICAP